MKKRIFLIVSSIVCCILTLSLVIYTIVKATQVGGSQTPNGDDPTVDVSKPGYDESTQSQNVVYNMIVGDVLTDEVLVNNPSALPSILTLSADNKVVAVEAGNALFAVESDGVKYNFDVTVWTKGGGSSEDPFNIINAEDLVELIDSNNGADVYYAQRVDIDLAGQNWKPIGDAEHPFKSNYNGNGFAIKNMSIVVNEENLGDYICDAYGFNAIYLGFFGFTYSSLDKIVIENINVDNAVIDTTAIDNLDVIEDANIDEMFVGALVGYMYNTEVKGADNTVSVVIKSSAGDHDGVDGAVGGLAGNVVALSEISGYAVNSTIDASNASYIDKNGKVYGATVGGLAGMVGTSVIVDCTVNTDIIIANYLDTRVAGAVANIENGSTIQDLNVENVKISINKVAKDASQCVRIAGAADYISSNSKMLNTSVNNAQIFAVGSGQVSGLVSVNEGIITDSSAKGTLKGAYVAGLVDTNKGSITYSDTTGIDAVNVEIHAQMWGAGLVNENRGSIVGSLDKTAVNAQIYWYKVAEKYFDKSNSMLAGIAVLNSGEISNLHVIACMYDAVNAGGAVGWVSGTGTKLTDVEVYTTVRTIKQSGDSQIQTYILGGVACIVGENSDIAMNGVVAKMSVNSKAISAYKYTLDVFGGLVGKCFGTVSADEIELGISVFANDTLNVNEDNKNCAKVHQIFGGCNEIAVTGSVIDKDINIYGNVNVNGTATSIKNCPAC